MLSVILSCTAEKQDELITYENHTIHEASVFLSPETSGFTGTPGRIKAYAGGLYFTDYAFRRIVKTDREGNKIHSFGRRGQGPGEFDLPSGFWKFEDYFLIYDYNGFKFITYDLEGNLVSESVVETNPVNPDGFPPNIPLTVHAISPNELLIPSRGRNGSLFAMADINTADVQFFGDAIWEHVESYDSEKVQQAFLNGEIPPIFMNMVQLASNSAGIYSFQQTTGILEKYTYSGDLLWEKDLKIPAQEDLFDQIARENQVWDGRGGPPQLFAYAKAVDANEKGVAVLLNMPEKQPVTVVWVPDDGNHFDVLAFHGLDEAEIDIGGSFSISSGDSRAYFLNNTDGIIYKAEWPF